MALGIRNPVVFNGPRLRPDPSWIGRRRVVRLSLLTCLVMSEQAILGGADLAQSVLPWTAGLAGAVIGSYVFGASWERVSGVASQNRWDNEEYGPNN